MKKYKIMDISTDEPYLVDVIEDDSNWETSLKEAIEESRYVGEGSILVAREMRQPTEREKEIGDMASDILRSMY